MKLLSTLAMNKPTEGRILLVGEGNFSLSASLVENGVAPGPHVTASCIDTFTAVQQAHSLAASNIDFLEKAGATVLFEVDATDLHTHPDISFYEYERVIFNFPLADRHKIKKNRQLLSDFFSSVKNILNEERGQVMVTLCKGQGGTPADQPMRSWHDSWQIVSMAANASFILTQVHPFHAKEFPRYASVGFRFVDKAFNTDSALIHVFEIAKTVSVPEISASRRFIRQDTDDYVIAAYVRRKLDRWSLLDKEGHPIRTILQHLAASLTNIYPSLEVLQPNDPVLPKVLNGFKSSLNVCPAMLWNETESMDTEDTMNQAEGTLLTGAGEGKAVLTEGKDEGNVFRTLQGDSAKPLLPISKEMKDLQNAEKATMSVAGEFTSHSPEVDLPAGTGQTGKAVVAAPSFKHGADRGDGGDEKKAVEIHHPVLSPTLPACVPVFVVHKKTDQQPNPPSLSEAEDADTLGSPGTGDVDLNEPQRAQHSGLKPNSDDQQSNTFSNLFHLRNSLLETLPHICGQMKEKSQTSVLASGTTFGKRFITPHELAVGHEAVFLAAADVSNPRTADLAAHLCETLRVVVGEANSGVIKQDSVESLYALEDGRKICIRANIVLQQEQRTVVLAQVFSFEAEKTDSPAAVEVADEPAACSHDGAIFHLDCIACCALHLPDVRLLWSEDARFMRQFVTTISASNHSSPVTHMLSTFAAFRPFSLYPVRFVHDLSFWENPARLFDETELLDVVREVADDVVTSISLVDRFESAEQGKRSHCYRLVFQSYDRVLSYIMSWKLQNVIRLKVALALGVELR